MSDHIIELSALRANISATETITIPEPQRARTLAERTLLVHVAAYSGTGSWTFTAERQEDTGTQAPMLVETTAAISAVGWFVFTPRAGLLRTVYPTDVIATLNGTSTITYRIYMSGRDPF